MEEEKSYQEIRTELIKKYATTIVPNSYKYKNEWIELYVKYGYRGKNDLKKAKTINTIMLSGYCIYFFYMLFYTLSSAYKDGIPVTLSYIFSSIIFWLLIPSVVTGMVIIHLKVAYKKNKSLYSRLKNTIIPIVCECFSSLKYIPDNSHYTEEYKNACVIPTNHNIIYDDCFKGKHKNVEFIIEELNTSRLTYSFEGVIIQIKLNKKFRGHTVIYPNSDFHIAPSKNLHHTELEDVIFEKKYDVYTNDDVEARYLITTGFMKRLNDIKGKFFADKIYAAFYNGIFYLALDTNKDLFEISSDKNICDEGKYYNLVEEIISIYKLIDYFKLNQNIGM